MTAPTSAYPHWIGDTEVIVVSDGVFAVPFEIAAVNREAGDVMRWMSSRALDGVTIPVPLNVAVVRSGDRVIMIDTGFGPRDGMGVRVGNALHRVESAGVDLRSVTDLVFTHFHGDHTAGLLADGAMGRFAPGVRIHASAREMDFWSAASPDLSQSGVPPESRAGMVEGCKRFIEATEGRVSTFEESSEIAPGVVARLAPGHTPGHAIVEVESEGERLAFVGDAILAQHFEHPGWHFAFDTLPEIAVDTRGELIERYARRGDTVVGTHLSFPSIGRIVRDGGAHRYVPAVWGY